MKESECPGCGTSYRIEDSKIPDKGILARCPKCQARFFLSNEIRADRVICQKCSAKECPKCGVLYAKMESRVTTEKKDLEGVIPTGFKVFYSVLTHKSLLLLTAIVTIGTIIFTFVLLTVFSDAPMPLFDRVLQAFALSLLLVVIILWFDKEERIIAKKTKLRVLLGMVAIVLIIFATVNFRSADAPTRSTTDRFCFSVGYRYGRCAALSMRGLPCDPRDDIVIPEECRGMPEAQKGIDAGVRSVAK